MCIPYIGPSTRAYIYIYIYMYAHTQAEPRRTGKNKCPNRTEPGKINVRKEVRSRDESNRAGSFLLTALSDLSEGPPEYCQDGTVRHLNYSRLL